TTMNSAEVPGFSFPRTWLMKSWSIPDFSILPKSPPRPAPTAIPRTGTKNRQPKSSPQNMPHIAPLPTERWLVVVLYFPSLSHTLVATASAWIARSDWSLWTSSMAAKAVVVSGYAIAIRSVIRILLPRETCALTRLSLPGEPPPAQPELVLGISTEPNDAAEPAWPVEALMRIYYSFYKT